MDDQRRGHLRDDLKGLVKGELHFDHLARSLYATDASIFQVQPLGVVVPRDEDDVCAVMRYCAEQDVAVVPRGAGTGVAGESLGPGLVIDLSRHFRAILDEGAETVRVQPGVVLRDLNQRLAASGRRFAPDPASVNTCTLGGMLATNASGSQVLRHGYTRDHVAALRLVLDNGEVVSVQSPPGTSQDEATGRLASLVAGVWRLLDDHGELIRASQPRTRFNRLGYHLHDIRTPRGPDLVQLLVGSEGTLGIFTEATLRTIPLPVGRGAALLGFDSIEAAVRAAQVAVPTNPVACDLLDRRLLSVARAAGNDLVQLVSRDVEAVLLIGYESDTPTGAAAAVRELIDRTRDAELLAMSATPAFESDDIDRLWRLREVALPSLYGLRGGSQPVPLIEDVGVPLDALIDYLRGVQTILKRHETTASFLVHAGSGQVHTRPFLDLQRAEEVNTLWAIAEEVHSLALDLGGTVSTQHGTGLARTPWVSRQYRKLYPVFRELKEIFDPKNLLNPGKIIGPLAGEPTWPLRRFPAQPADEPEPRHLRWQPGELRLETVNCNGCGQCRTEAPSLRMCPIFRATHAEAATPRAKANMLRQALAPGADPRLFSSDEVRAVTDLCVNCRMCAVECPAHVNIPKLMLETKAANVIEHGLTRADWVMARTESFAAFGSMLAPLVNVALQSRIFRWLLEKSFGVARQRRLPAFAARNFLRRAERRGWSRPPRSGRPRYAYLVDLYATYNDPLSAEAVVAVLQHHDLDVFVPPGQRGCGMAPLAAGDVDTAREVVAANLNVLTDLVRDGYQVLCAEPTAALMIRQHYPDLGVDPVDAQLVADHTVEFTALLGDLHRAGKLRTDFQPLEFGIGYHVPCHLKALGGVPEGPGLLSLIPGLRVRTIDVSCSGMAGTFGLKAENYDLSLEAGKPMLDVLRRPDVLFGCTECSTCRLQMEDGGGKRTLHPAQYLALAYGLMPELVRRLRRPIRDLVL